MLQESENKGLRKISGPKKDDTSEQFKYCIVRKIVIYAGHQVKYGRLRD
jgi:hypothetical protein